ncbi:MAG TPA: hypothetical protein VHQ47_01140 [Phycisphaerae bacterium]|nr:hypothetical protein [Phycisphaerae bacterium]
MRKMGSVAFTAIFAGGVLALAPITRAESVLTSEVFHFPNDLQSTGVSISGAPFDQGASSAETEATFTGSGATAGAGYVHSTAQSVDGFAPTLQVHVEAQGAAGSDWITSAADAVVDDSLTLSGPDASKVAFLTVSAAVHVVFSGASPGSSVIVSPVVFPGEITGSGDYTGIDTYAYTGQPISFEAQLLAQAEGFATPDATHSNFASVDATVGNQLTPNGDGTFTESGPFLFTFYDADGNPLTDVTATGSSGISYTATTIVTPEPASLTLLACAAVPLLSIRRRRSGVR